jgi:hypothetical protein
MVKVLYTGIGANESHIHTVQQFLEIMHYNFTNRNWLSDPIYRVSGRNHYQLQYKDWNLPDEFIKFKLPDWIDYSGAELID